MTLLEILIIKREMLNAKKKFVNNLLKKKENDVGSVDNFN